MESTNIPEFALPPEFATWDEYEATLQPVYEQTESGKWHQVLGFVLVDTDREAA